MIDFIKKVESSDLPLPIIILFGFLIRATLLFHFIDLPLLKSEIPNILDIVLLGSIQDQSLIKVICLLNGIFLIFIGYFHSLHLLHSRLVAITTAFFIAISPLSLIYSFDYNAESFSLSFLLISLTLFYLRIYWISFVVFAFSILFSKSLILAFPLGIITFLKLEEGYDNKKILKILFQYTLIFLIFFLIANYMPFVEVPYSSARKAIGELQNSFHIIIKSAFGFGILMAIFLGISGWYLNKELCKRMSHYGVFYAVIGLSLLLFKGPFNAPLIEHIGINVMALTLGLIYKKITTSQQLHHQA